MSRAAADPPTDAPRALARATRSATLLFVLAVLAARLLFLALAPYELVADEAHYWEWSRRPDLSYYSKGPGVAWTIAAATRALGTGEFAVRAASPLFAALAALALARLAERLARDPRAGFLAAALFTLIPAYQATALLMTIDGPMFACWAVGMLAAVTLADRLRDRAGTLAPAAALGLALGAGFLFKYTVLFLPAGLACFALLRREGRALFLNPRGAGALALAGTLFLAVASPVFIWNASHGWPTVAHLLGHVGAPGGDAAPPPAGATRFNPLWTLELIGAQLLLIGPALVLLALGARRARGDRDGAHRLLLDLAWPVLAFYLAVSLFSDAEGNWPLAAYLSLIPLAAAHAVGAWDVYLARLRGWRADPSRPKRGLLRRRPETLFQVARDWTIGVGVATALGIALLPAAARLPFVGPLVPLDRFSGHRAWAARIALLADEAERLTGRAPIIVADSYARASLLAFYLPGRPTVFSAQHALGGRESSYDYFPETDLASAADPGTPMVLVGKPPEVWGRAFAGLDIGPASADDRAWVALSHSGLRANPPEVHAP